MGVVIMRMHDGRGRLPFHVHVDRGRPKGRIECLGRQPLPAYLWGGEGAVVSTCMLGAGFGSPCQRTRNEARCANAAV